MKITLPLAILAAVITATSATAITYDVNRSWSDSSGSATLVGTVDVPIGNHAISSAGAHPFSNINLVLTVNGNPQPVLTSADTSLIGGSGVFNIQATATELIFDAIGNGGNPADLAFAGAGTVDYVIGSNGTPAFERARPGPIEDGFQFPIVWARASTASVPEGGASLAFLGLGLLGLTGLRRKLGRG